MKDLKNKKLLFVCPKTPVSGVFGQTNNSFLFFKCVFSKKLLFVFPKTPVYVISAYTCDISANT